MKKQINKMCSDCKKLNVSCRGTVNQYYTGCIFKKKERRENMNCNKAKLFSFGQTTRVFIDGVEINNVLYANFERKGGDRPVLKLEFECDVETISSDELKTNTQ